MAATMASRGPDGQGTWWDEIAGLAFRRLAIIDLHARSNQPMHLEHLHLVFNGEIYNYRELRSELVSLGRTFQTEGDAEVLLNAWATWGEATLDRLNGMFGFAVWDSRQRSLTLATDPFGEKPVYFASLPSGGLVFGSAIRALLCDRAVRASPNEHAVEAFLTHGVMPSPDESFFTGIDRLPAAHLLRWEAGHHKVKRYWQPGRVPVPVPEEYPEAVLELRELLASSVSIRLRSDVPVGTSLSGGIDSSAIVALVAENSESADRHAFTASFPGFARDEWRYADEVARMAGVKVHHRVEPTAAGALEDLRALVWEQEEPVGSLSIYAQMCVMKAAKTAGITVLLDGQGGDELFGGYEIAAGFALRSEKPGTAIRQIARAPIPLGGLVARSMAMDYLPAPLRTMHRARTASPYASRHLRWQTALGEAPQLGWITDEDPLRRELLSESFVTSLPQLLRYADRSSMAVSREVRLPLLDRRIAEFAWSLPAGFLYREGVTKAILRDAVRDLVPDNVLNRQDKVGFEPPQARWLRAKSLQECIGQTLLRDAARHRGLYDARVIKADLDAGSWRDPRAIWRALNVELWLTRFFD